MNPAELLDLYTRQQRIEAQYPDMRKEVDGQVIRLVSLMGEDGYVFYSHLDEQTAGAAIDAQIARFQEIGQDFEWKVFDYDPPKDLVERLRRRGFETGEPEALVVLDLTTGPDILSLAVPPAVTRLTRPDEVDAVVALESAVWEEEYLHLGEFLKRDLREHPDLLSLYISYEGELPASAAWIYFHPGTRFASLLGGATLPRFRHRGHYTRLLAARAQEALARGFTYLSVDASPMSRPILERHGFQYLATTTPCTWKFG